jgi:predicted ATPase
LLRRGQTSIPGYCSVLLLAKASPRILTESLPKGEKVAYFLGYHYTPTLIAEGLSMLRAAGATVGTPWMLTNLAEAYGRLGQPGEGLNCLTEAAQIIEATGERRDEVEVHRLRGDLLNATGDGSAAEQSYEQAIAVAQRQSAKLFELRACLDLARLWRDQGKPSEARKLLTPIYSWFTEGFDTPVLQDAKTLLDELA